MELLNDTTGDGGQGAELCQPTSSPHPWHHQERRCCSAIPLPENSRLVFDDGCLHIPLPRPLEGVKGTRLSEPSLLGSRGARGGRGESPWCPHGWQGWLPPSCC